MFMLILFLACTKEKEDTGITLNCEELSLEECSSGADCSPRSARLITFDDVNECWTTEEPQNVSCMDAVLSCMSVETYAHAPDSQECWFFSNSCIPEGWTLCSDLEEPGCG
jgi:hypothetical protein